MEAFEKSNADISNLCAIKLTIAGEDIGVIFHPSWLNSSTLEIARVISFFWNSTFNKLSRFAVGPKWFITACNAAMKTSILTTHYVSTSTCVCREIVCVIYGGKLFCPFHNYTGTAHSFLLVTAVSRSDMLQSDNWLDIWHKACVWHRQFEPGFTNIPPYDLAKHMLLHTKYNSSRLCSSQYVQSTYFVLCWMVFCYDKVESPVMLLFASTIHMCTVRLWCPHSPNDTNSTEVAQLDATIGTLHGEHPSIQLLKTVGKFILRVFGWNKAEIWQHFLIFSESPVLDL